MRSIPEFLEELTGMAAILPLASFPMNDLPSGGMSTRISPSEMFMVIVESCQKDRITMTWKDPADGTIAQFTEMGPMVYEFLGHFGWEIKNTGKYSVLIKTAREDAKIDFEVV